MPMHRFKNFACIAHTCGCIFLDHFFGSPFRFLTKSSVGSAVGSWACFPTRVAMAQRSLPWGTPRYWIRHLFSTSPTLISFLNPPLHHPLLFKFYSFLPITHLPSLCRFSPLPRAPILLAGTAMPKALFSAITP